jgi:hypothetical protein
MYKNKNAFNIEKRASTLAHVVFFNGHSIQFHKTIW